MPAVYAPALPPATEALRSEQSSADRLLRLDAALRDMAQTCPMPTGIQDLAERLDEIAGMRASRRRPRPTRRAGVA
jgi:hypothetical protein